MSAPIQHFLRRRFTIYQSIGCGESIGRWERVLRRAIEEQAPNSSNKPGARRAAQSQLVTWTVFFSHSRDPLLFVSMMTPTSTYRQTTVQSTHSRPTSESSGSACCGNHTFNKAMVGQVNLGPYYLITLGAIHRHWHKPPTHLVRSLNQSDESGAGNQYMWESSTDSNARSCHHWCPPGAWSVRNGSGHYMNRLRLKSPV